MVVRDNDKPNTFSGKLINYTDNELAAILDALSNDLPNSAVRMALHEASRRLNN